jgi:hypothetical protein
VHAHRLARARLCPDEQPLSSNDCSATLTPIRASRQRGSSHLIDPISVEEERNRRRNLGVDNQGLSPAVEARRRAGAARSKAPSSLPVYSRPQIIATEVVRLPPMLKVRKFFAPSICRAPAWLVSC